MIPDLAIIVAAYVCFRMLEVCLFKSDRYLNKGVHVLLRVLAVLIILLTIVMVLDIVTKGTPSTFTP